MFLFLADEDNERQQRHGCPNKVEVAIVYLLQPEPQPLFQSTAILSWGMKHVHFIWPPLHVKIIFYTSLSPKT